MEGEDNLNHVLKFFVKSSFVLFIGAILSKIFTYLYRVIIARNFGQEDYGLFSIAVIVFNILATILSFGLQSGLVRYIPLYRGKNENEKIKTIVPFSLKITLVTGIFGAVLFFFFSDILAIGIFHNQELGIFFKVFAVFMPIFLFAGLFHSIVLSYEKVGWYSFIGNILGPLSQLTLLFLFILTGLGTQPITLSYAMGYIFILLASFLVCRFSIKTVFGESNLKKNEKEKITKKLLSYSFPIIFLGVVNYLFSSIDSFFIGYYKSISYVGIYNAAVPIALFLLIIPTLFLQLFLPVITKEYSKGNISLIVKLSKQLGKWIFFLNLPLLIIMFLFPGAVINLLFGVEYLEAEIPLRFLSLGFFFYSLFQISENLLSMVGKSKKILFNWIIATIVIIILNVFLVPKYGINGAAFSTMVGYFIVGILSIITAKHYTSIIPFKREIIKIFLVSTIPAAILFYIRSQIVLTPLIILLLGISFVIVYVGLIFLTHSLDKNDLMILSAIKEKIVQRTT
jgi:O-antigen/teichoic acid export membrane protein